MRHSLAARGVPTSMGARAVYTVDLPPTIQMSRYRFRGDEFVEDVLERYYNKNPTPFATWLVNNTDERAFYRKYPYLWWDVFDKDYTGFNVLMPVYDTLNNYIILGFIGIKKDVLKLLRKILELNPGDYEASMAYYHISNSDAADNREIFYTTTDMEGFDETEFLLGKWEEYDPDSQSLVLAEGDTDIEMLEHLQTLSSTRRDVDRMSDKEFDEWFRENIG